MLGVAGGADRSAAIFAHGMATPIKPLPAILPTRIRVPLRLLLAHRKARIIWIVEQLRFEVLFLLWRPRSQRKSQKLIGSAGFHILFIQEVE